jgi:hypothetical protein
VLEANDQQGVISTTASPRGLKDVEQFVFGQMFEGI